LNSTEHIDNISHKQNLDIKRSD